MSYLIPAPKEVRMSESRLDATNLNDLRIVTDGRDGGSVPMRNYSARTAEIDVYFRDLDRELISLMPGYDWAVGNVAWLTSKPILLALAELKGVSIVV